MRPITKLEDLKIDLENLDTDILDSSLGEAQECESVNDFVVHIVNAIGAAEDLVADLREVLNGTTYEAP